MRALLLVCFSLSLLAQPTPEKLASIRGEMEKTLRENIAKFWLEKSIDKENGGYLISFDAEGKAVLPATKGIVSQSRNVWLYSNMFRNGYGGEELRSAARHGYQFLRDDLWDAEHGGFYWEVDAEGKPLKPMKHLYGNAFGLYAVSEYAYAFKDQGAREFAIKIAKTLEAKAHDAEFGGFRESFERDWSTPAADNPGYMSAPPDMKLMNTHLHLMEAYTAFYRVAPEEARARLQELVNIETNAVVRKNLGACTDRYDRNWTPRLDGTYATASYGHDLENVWLVLDSLEVLQQRPGPFRDLFESLWAYSLKYGYDEANGGFYYTGPLGAPAVNQDKSWWVQAEVMVSALRMYELTRDPKYWSVFEKTWYFVRDHQIDWKNGEWWPSVKADGKGTGAKGHLWKAGYHNGRAMIESIAAIKRLQASLGNK